MKKIVFTNGCFDIIHSGHIELLEKARELGTKLIVGINSDDSVRSIKGSQRPIIGQQDRAVVLIGLKAVDEVRIFDEATPENLIRELKPDVLVKGGDWDESEIVGAEFVRSRGGQVVTIPIKEGFSTTEILNRIKGGETPAATRGEETQPAGSLTGESLRSHISVFEKLISEQSNRIDDCGRIILETLTSGGKIMLCGNGGSAADAQHIAAELIGRYESERRALPAIALTTDTSALTALSNDYSFERVFSRQVEGLANPGDLLIAISTSGNSPNVIRAIMAARNRGCKVIGLTASGGKKMAALCDACVMVPGAKTSRIQEAHIAIGHIWCELIDQNISAGTDN